MLNLAHVNAWYGPQHIIHDLSLCLGAGEILALLGRNGAGKTTTLRTVMGLVDRREGVIELDGVSLMGLRASAISRRGVAYVPEFRGIFSDLTVAENLAIAGFRRTDFSIEQVLDLFPALKRMLGRKGRQLSGGEQQMLAIGRALLSSPKYLLLDEPSQGLAPAIVDKVIETLQHLRGRAIGILLVEQNAEIALDLADRVSIIDQGSIAFGGTGDDLRNRPEMLSTYLALGSA
jgi:branched-chain amino acid transport system ATP-binding protein